MYDGNIVLQPTDPWILQAVGPGARIRERIQMLLGGMPGFRLITLDGSAMKTWGALYDELTRKLQLPDYFGRNLNALDECLTDMEWLGAKGFVLLIQNAEQVLRDETAQKREGFFDVLRHAGTEWSQPVSSGGPWDRPATPFHVILQSESGLSIPEIPPLAII